MGLELIPLYILLVTFLMGILILICVAYRDISGRIPFKKTYYLITKNRIFLCERCKKYHRMYQWSTLYETKNKSECPHCGDEIVKYYSMSNNEKDLVWRLNKRREKRYDKWLDHHPDCPKVSSIEYSKLQYSIKRIKKTIKEQDAIKRFQDYNNMKFNSKWIENLSKTSKS